MTRTDNIPYACPKCGTPTTWHPPTFVRDMNGERLELRCRCGYMMTSKTNDAKEGTEP